MIESKALKSYIPIGVEEAVGQSLMRVYGENSGKGRCAIIGEEAHGPGLGLRQGRHPLHGERRVAPEREPKANRELAQAHFVRHARIPSRLRRGCPADYLVPGGLAGGLAPGAAPAGPAALAGNFTGLVFKTSSICAVIS